MNQLPVLMRDKIVVNFHLPKRAPADIRSVTNRLIRLMGSSERVEVDDTLDLKYSVKITWSDKKVLLPEIDNGAIVVKRFKLARKLYDYTDEDGKDDLFYIGDLLESLGAQNIYSGNPF